MKLEGRVVVEEFEREALKGGEKDTTALELTPVTDGARTLAG